LTDVLGLDETVARANACRMEPAVDMLVLDRLSTLMERLRGMGALENSKSEIRNSKQITKDKSQKPNLHASRLGA